MKNLQVPGIVFLIWLLSIHFNGNTTGVAQNNDTGHEISSMDDSLPIWAGSLNIPGNVRIAVPAPADERYAHLSWPKAVRTENGTIILAYLAGIHHTLGNSPAVSLSHDNGKTFGHPLIIKDFSPDYEYPNSGNLAIGIANDGAIVLLTMGHRRNEANHIFGFRSTDNGLTWIPVNTSALGPDKTGSVCGTIVQLPGNKLMVMGHYRSPSKPYRTGIWQSVSIDNGRSWGPPSMVTNVNGGEPVLVRADDRLLVFIRGRGPAAVRQYIAVSDDFGETWQTELSNITVQNAHTRGLAHPFAMINPGKGSELLVLTAERPLPGSVWLWRGDAGKLNFEADKCLMEIPKIENDNHTDYGYTWLLPVSENQFLMFYYHGLGRGANSIWVAEFRL